MCNFMNEDPTPAPPRGGIRPSVVASISLLGGAGVGKNARLTGKLEPLHITYRYVKTVRGVGNE